MTKSLITAFALLFSCASFAHQVIGIADGDTLTLLVDEKPLKIRLANIDAPEKKQAFGQRSKESLSSICWNTDATYTAQTIDRYGRTVAFVYCNGIEANKEQVNRGMAWVYPQYNRDSTLPSVEANAQSNKLGLWIDSDPVAPWEFRRKKPGIKD